ncbi:MAG: TSUP family transporter [Alphaproteobacteria bacterium]|nr:TSUP family transporter [Alphaproteobacteria bacterium]
MIEFDANLLAAAGFMILGGLLRGFLGFGGSMGAVPGLSLIYGPLGAVSIVLLADIGAVLQLLRTAVRQSDKRVVAPLALASVLTTPLGAWLLINIDPHDMQRAIAVTVLGFAAILAVGWRYQRPPTLPVVVGVGVVGGVLSGGAGMGAPPAVLFLLSGPHDHAAVRANIIGYLAVANMTALATIWLNGALSTEILWRAIVLAPPYLAAIWAGGHLFRFASEGVFRYLALAAVALVGIAALLF